MGRKNVEQRNVVIGKERTGNGNFVVITDPDTSEVITQYWEGQMKSSPGKKPPKKHKQPPYAKIWMPNLLKVVLKKELSTPEKALLFDLIAFLDWQSTMLVHPETGEPVNESDIARILKMSRNWVHETLGTLNKKGIIGKFNAGEGKPNKYHMNPDLIFYGQKLNDPLDRARFDKDCAFEPVEKIDYGIEENPENMSRRKLNINNKQGENKKPSRTNG